MKYLFGDFAEQIVPYVILALALLEDDLQCRHSFLKVVVVLCVPLVRYDCLGLLVNDWLQHSCYLIPCLEVDELHLEVKHRVFPGSCQLLCLDRVFG